jgi:NAD(P)H-nitrite reductase large subunit
MSADDAKANDLSAPSAPSLRDGDKGVILQRDRATFAIAPHLPCGLVTPEILRRIADVAERYGCTALKLTSAERIAMIGLAEKDIDAVWQDLAMPQGGAVGDVVRSVKACPGTQYCKRGQQDSIGVGLVLDERYHGKPMPGKLKMGISGCPNQCAESVIKDIGLVGTKPGWDLFVGGTGGAFTKLGTRIAKGKSTDEVLALVDGVFAFYQAHGRPKERLHKTLKRVGFEPLLAALGLPSLEASKPEA